jgi:hypothetical protein
MKHETPIEKSPPCGNEVFGCRRRVERHEWVREFWACKTCVRAAARWWCVAPADLPMVVTAFLAARAALQGQRPNQTQVWAILRDAGIERQIPIPDAPVHAPVERGLPNADRVAA